MDDSLNASTSACKFCFHVHFFEEFTTFPCLFRNFWTKATSLKYHRCHLEHGTSGNSPLAITSSQDTSYECPTDRAALFHSDLHDFLSTASAISRIYCPVRAGDFLINLLSLYYRPASNLSKSTMSMTAGFITTKAFIHAFQDETPKALRIDQDRLFWNKPFSFLEDSNTPPLPNW